jgi:hypothetical protein
VILLIKSLTCVLASPRVGEASVSSCRVTRADGWARTQVPKRLDTAKRVENFILAILEDLGWMDCRSNDGLMELSCRRYIYSHMANSAPSIRFKIVPIFKGTPHLLRSEARRPFRQPGDGVPIEGITQSRASPLSMLSCKCFSLLLKVERTSGYYVQNSLLFLQSLRCRFL